MRVVQRQREGGEIEFSVCQTWITEVCVFISCMCKCAAALTGAIRQIKRCFLYLPKGVLHLHTSTALFFLRLRCSATLQCHPVPAVMGKGRGRASHQHSATVSVHTQTLEAPRIYTNKWSRICKHKHTNKQTRINVCAYLHINRLIGIVRSVSSPHDSFSTPPGTIWASSVFFWYRKARAAQRLYWESVWTAGILKNSLIYTPFIRLLSQLRPPDFHTSHRKWPHTDSLLSVLFISICLDEKLLSACSHFTFSHHEKSDYLPV